jgi:hypothetical protein
MALGAKIDTNSTVDNITANSAQCGGKNISPLVYTLLEKGLVWSSTNPVPTIADNSFNRFPFDPTLNDFVCDMTGLNSNTLYYVRAYIKTTAGTPYVYDTSAPKQFTTLAAPAIPKVLTGANGKHLIAGSHRLVVQQ